MSTAQRRKEILINGKCFDEFSLQVPLIEFVDAGHRICNNALLIIFIRILSVPNQELSYVLCAYMYDHLQLPATDRCDKKTI